MIRTYTEFGARAKVTKQFLVLKVVDTNEFVEVPLLPGEYELVEGPNPLGKGMHWWALKDNTIIGACKAWWKTNAEIEEW